jgi:cytochrome P450
MDIDRALTDPGFFADHDPHSLWQQLRREDPIHWTEGRVRPFWSITRYDDIVAAFSEPNLFTSSRGVVVPSSPELEQVPPEMRGAGQMMIMTDPPLHGAMRRAFNRLLLPRAVGLYDDPGRRLVAEILDGVLDRGTCDFVVDVAARLPMAFICEIMGIPRRDWSDMFTWGNMALGFEDAEYQVESGSAMETSSRGVSNLGRYCVQHALERRGGNGEDLLSVLGNAEINGRKLTEGEIFHNGFQYIIGGLETTRNAISGGLLALIQHPAECTKLINNPSVMRTAIEEILRWSSPITHIARVATRAIEFRGKLVREGDMLALWLPSGNRDEQTFEHPYRFDIERTPNEQIAFGQGEHFCAGAHLARLELRLMMHALVHEVEQIDLAGPVERLRSNLVAGIKHMPVRFKRTHAAVA